MSRHLSAQFEQIPASRNWFCQRRLLLCTLLLVFHSFLPEVSAQETIPLAADLAATSPPVRIGEVMPTIWDIQKHQPGIMEGRFEFRVHLGTAEFYRYTTDDIVLHESSHRFRWLFPPIVTPLRSPELEIDVTWQPKNGERIPLKMQLVRVPFSASRTVMMGVGEDRGLSRHPDWDARLNKLTLESLGPANGASQDAAAGRLTSLQTVLVSWNTDAFPVDPAGFVPYEVVTVGDHLFSRLRAPQLESLLAWCRSGGSVYVEPGGQLDAIHLRFLNELTAEYNEQPRWSIDAAGQLDWSFIDSPFVSASCGRGRVIVADSERIDDAQLRTAALWLWRWPSELNPFEVALPLLSAGQLAVDRSREAATGPRAVETLLETALLPAQVQVLPREIVAGLLLILVLAIGPVDYWLLGRWKLRRLTWLTWPAWTILITLVTVSHSNWYLRAADVPRSLIIHDLDVQGRIVATHRFQHFFAGYGRVQEQAVQQAVWQPLASASLRSAPSLQLPQGTNAAVSIDLRQSALLHQPTFSGRFPQSYTASIPLTQWTPQLTYEWQIPHEAIQPFPEVDWAAWDQRCLADDESLSTDLLQPFPSAEPEKAVLMRLSPQFSAMTVTESGTLASRERLLMQLTGPQEAYGPLRVSPQWNSCPYRGLFYSHLADEHHAAVMLLAVESENTLTVYRRAVRALSSDTSSSAEPALP